MAYSLWRIIVLSQGGLDQREKDEIPVQTVAVRTVAVRTVVARIGSGRTGSVWVSSWAENLRGGFFVPDRLIQ